MWAPAFLMRVHGMSAADAGFFLGAVAPVGAVGAMLGGWAADRLGRRDMRWYAWLPTITLFAALPFQATQVLADTRWIALSAFVPAGLIGGIFAPTSYAIVQNLAPPQMRASASAIMLLFLNLIGLGCGPQAVGILSDLLHASFGDESLRYALLLAKVMTVAAALLYWSAARAMPPGPASEPDSIK
jgi:MFS family permease